MSRLLEHCLEEVDATEAERFIRLSRAGRSLEAPTSKPVILLDGDLLLVNGRQLRVYLHGETEAAHPPRLGASSLGRAARATAAALALSAVVGLGSAAGEPASGGPPIEVRARPPVVPPMRVVLCQVTSLAPGKNGLLQVQATCPKSPAVPVGAVGALRDEKGLPIKDGGVKVTRVDRTKLSAEATQLKKVVGAKKIRFLVVDRRARDALLSARRCAGSPPRSAGERP